MFSKTARSLILALLLLPCSAAGDAACAKQQQEAIDGNLENEAEAVDVRLLQNKLSLAKAVVRANGSNATKTRAPIAAIHRNLHLHTGRASQPVITDDQSMYHAVSVNNVYRVSGSITSGTNPTTCEDMGYKTILDAGECLAAGAALTGQMVEFAGDMPAGGYPDTGPGRPAGCGIHMWAVENLDAWKMQYFPTATGGCGTYGWYCICMESPDMFSMYRVMGTAVDGGTNPTTCEDMGMSTILDVSECQAAGAVLTGRPDIGFAGDMPTGGYPDTSTGRPAGCAISKFYVQEDSAWILQHFPYAKGGCGTYNWYCVCKQSTS